MPKSTQSYLDVAEIKQDSLVLKDGSFRAVVLVSSINFALKSEEEQKALVGAYVTMLNSLDYPLQILVQSRPINVDDYLNELQDLAHSQTNELLKSQTQDYLDFVREIITLGHIMTKKFYVIVPFDPGGHSRPGFFKRLLSVFKPTKVIYMREEVFERAAMQLEKRISNVLTGLSGLSLSAVRLDTQALIELFYATYNPEIAQVQKFGKVEDIQVEKIGS